MANQTIKPDKHDKHLPASDTASHEIMLIDGQRTDGRQTQCLRRLLLAAETQE